ncbi:MAG: ATP-dependent sacrificial sulfur transferase LarE [Planctomycetota bacterium]|nr:ATP-dependent sacrificial sulfur transferase LarE [Planctomycetota bacterium]
MATTDREFDARVARLDEVLAGLGRVAVAFSGGVDSTVLLHAAHRVLGERDGVAVIADSPSLPRAELHEAREVAESIGARLVEVRTDEGDDPAYRANAGDRCYFCKAALFRAMESFARSERFPCLAFGEIVDDWSDDRPGARAAREFGVVAPLSAAGFGKEDVRRYAALHGLPVADKPASACLASRIPVGTEVTPERLARVETAEAGLKGLGFRVLRVRHHGTHARVEVGADEEVRAREVSSRIEAVLAEAGFESHELAVYGQL